MNKYEKGILMLDVCQEQVDEIEKELKELEPNLI